MASILNMLQASLSGVDPSEMVGEEVVVTGSNRAPVYEDDPSPPPMGNRSMIEEARGARDNAPARQGMFGTKGTLRDVLGILGDSLLVGNDRDRIYQPRRDSERRQDALSGFSQNPMAAIERLAQVDEKAAMDLYKEVQDQQMAQQTATRQQRNLERQELGTRSTERFKRLELGSRMANGAKTPEDLVALRGWIEGTVDDSALPDHMLQAAGITGYQQAQIPQRQQQLGISQQNADTAARNAQTSASRPNRSISPVEYLQQLQGIPPNERTKEEQDYITRNTEPRAPAKGANRASSMIRGGSSGTPSGTSSDRPRLRVTGSRPAGGGGAPLAQ